jgi:hypothetical protein
VSWGPDDERNHPRDPAGRWAEKLSARMIHPFDDLDYPEPRPHGNRSFAGAKMVPVSAMLQRLELWSGQVDVYDQRSDRWVNLGEVRPGRGTDRVQFRGRGPGPALFSRNRTDSVIVRRATGQAGA